MSDPVIDPNLEFMQRLLESSPNELPQTGPLDNINQLSFPDHFSDEEDLPDRISSLPPADSSNAAMNTSSTDAYYNQSRPLAALSQAIKRRKRFSAETEAELDNFVQAIAPAKHMLMIYALQLETRDLIAQQLKSTKSVKWEVPTDLASTIRAYSQALILSPTIASYRGNASEVVLKAMCELNVANVPPASEPSRVKSVIESISKALTSQRNVVKTAVVDSTDHDSPTRNIAILACALTKTCHVKPTVQLYIRLAFIRWHVVTYPTLVTTKQFWPHVDQSMQEYRQNLKTEARISLAFNDIYQKDKQLYGDPADSGVQVTEVRDLETWQLTLIAHAGQVEPGADGDAGGARKKRKR